MRSQRTIVPALLLLTLCAAAQEQPAATPAPTPGAQEPKIRVTYLNVCTPPDDEKKALVEALEHVPAKPPLAADFEVARGRSTMSGGELAARLTGGNLPPSTWVRMRREFASGYYANAQYSMTRDEDGIAEVLVFRVRDPKELMQVAISDSVTATDPGAVLAVDTPAARIKLERFGKASVALAHCPGADQSAYQPIFNQASQLLRAYRDLLGARRTVPAEFSRLGGVARPKPAPAKPQKP